MGHGLAVARRLGDTVSVGVGVTHYDASMIGAVQEFLWDDDSIESFFAPSSYLPARLHLEETVRIRGDDWALTGGILWRPTENWSIGAVYQQGLDARVDLEMIAGPASDMGVPPGSVLVRRTGIPIHFPDAYGLGAAYRASDGRLTLSVQWDRVEYSDLMRSVEAEGVAIDDADQLHIGAEYVFLDWTPIIAVRFGAWREPDHQVHSTSNDVWERALLPRRRDETHYAVGFGAAMRRFQVDFAVDLAKRVNTVSLSAIYNF